MRSLKALAACIAAGALLALPVAAQAANPACGSTITHDVKLTADMDCSASNTTGLEIGKAGLTVDLNGHSLIGPDALTVYTGIDDTAGYDRLTIKNGSVRGYGENVYIEYSTGSRILHVHAGSTSAYSYYGIDLEYSANTVVDHSTAAIGYASGSAFYLYENTGVTLKNSKVAAMPSSATGVYDYESSSKIVNVKANGGDYGFDIDYPLGSVIKDSTANGNNYGFYVSDNFPTVIYQATLSDNKANNNNAYGFYADLPAKGSGNRATGNGTANCHHVTCSH